MYNVSFFRLHHPIMQSKLLLIAIILFFGWSCEAPQEVSTSSRPNILLVISDDQSWLHTSASGYEAIQTPAFDRIAHEGILFTQAFAASPGCSPSRAALLTGRHCWQLEHAGTHASSFDIKYITYPELLANAGYQVGFTGKGWGPGNYEAGGRTHNPAGPAWREKRMESPQGISDVDYAGNFELFLEAKAADQPFCFWMGGHEPHRIFKKGIGQENGLDVEKVKVPAFLPDRPEIRNDMLDYCYEIQWFDQHLQRAIQLLEEKGILENTLIIVTSDNGMAFPRAKANAYEYGIHVPMAIRWGAKVKGGRISDDLVGFADIAPTILEVTGVQHTGAFPMSGKSIFSLLTSEKSGKIETDRNAVYSSRERHSSSRYHSLAYPQRSLRTDRYLYIRNFKPERWPAGTPQKYGTVNYLKYEEVATAELGPMHGGYHDIDACPTLDFLIDNADDPEIGHFLNWSVDKRPAEELFDIGADPACLNNLADDAAHADLKAQLSQQLMDYLKETGDPRVTGNGDIWETYPRYSRLRKFPEPEWAKAHPEDVPEQPWLDEFWKKN